VLHSDAFEREGYTRLDGPADWLDAGRRLVDRWEPEARHGGVRNILDDLEAQGLAARIGAALSPGREVFAVRALLFDKRPGSNWKVPRHQDLSVAVAAKGDVSGFGPWSVKAGVVHARAPAEVLERMFAVRLHLDRTDALNGPLRVVPGSHTDGVLSPDAIAAARSEEVVVEADAGDVLVMRPLLLHASSAAEQPRHRRVLHIEFSSLDAPAPLDWRWRVSSTPN